MSIPLPQASNKPTTCQSSVAQIGATTVFARTVLSMRRHLNTWRAWWSRFPVQVKFLTIAIPLIILMVTAAFFVLERDYYAKEQTKLLITQKKTSFSQALLLAAPLHMGDLLTVKRLLATIIADPTFVGAAIRDSTGLLVTVGDDVLSGNPAYLFAEAISYGDDKGIHELGHLITLTSDVQIRQAMRARFQSHLIIMATLALGLGFAVLVAYRHTIGDPLSTIVQTIRTTREAEIPAQIPWNSPDEIGQLAHAFNKHIEDEWSYKQELVLANAHLEERIEMRTRELSEALERANEANAIAARMAMEDSLTGLPNRRAFTGWLDNIIAATKRRDELVAVMLIDLDRFKNINDTLGHSVGDQLLQKVADRLRRSVGATGNVARLGGDEFAVSINKVTRVEEIAAHASRIVADLDRSVTINGTVIHPGASVGISCYPADGNTNGALMANADIALYRAKENGRGRFCFFDVDMRTAVDQADRIEKDLRHALDAGDLQLFYQPKVELLTGRRTGFEALLRWRHPTLGYIPPDEFLPVAEDRGLILKVGRTVIEQATADTARWLAAGLDPGTIAINVHPVELRRRDHMSELLNKIAERNLAFDRFVIEITENCVIGRGTEEAISLLSELRRQGLALSLDDFGTGYASLKHLKELPFDEIKIDRSFVADMTHEAGAAAIIQATMGLANSFRFRVVAEGIETAEQIDHLKSLGPIIGQGYAFHSPMSADDATALLAGDVVGPTMASSDLRTQAVEPLASLEAVSASSSCRAGLGSAKLQD